MPAANYTIDDTEPLIQYAQLDDWSDRTDDDLSNTRYSNNGTFTVCSTKHCSATFAFNGTQVWIYGSKRKDHGYYSVSLDGKTTEYDGFADPDDYTSLYDSGSLSEGRHTVIITNISNDTTRPYIDIDYITWSTDAAVVAPNITLKDTASQISYKPSDSWKTNLPDDMSGFQDDSGQSRRRSKSVSGDAITLYGAVGPNCSPYSIKVDGQSMGNFSATRLTYGAQKQLYYADSLGAGNHSLEVTNLPSSTGTGQQLAIDFALVAGLPSDAPTSTSTSTSSASASSSSSRPHERMPSTFRTVGIIAACVASVCLVATIVGLFVRHNTKRKRREKAVGRNSDISAFMNAAGTRSPSASVFDVEKSEPEHGPEADREPESETAHLLDTRSTA
ncbi:hypothetical protein C8R43DRAFT_1230552 [Mycena crocata]|nr:hypothetical protein C8R43DRAFT_1230552 [Mycena crocata]